MASIFDINYVQFILILLGGLAAASLLHIVLKVIFKRITEKTETDLDDEIYKIIIKPLYVVMLFIAGNIAVRTVPSIIQTHDWVDNLFFILYVLITAYVAAKVLNLLVTRWLRVQKTFEKTPQLLGKVVAVIVYLIAGLVILQHLHIEITPFIATLGIGGLAIGLALQNTLSNFFAGLHILSDQPVKVGDFIELEGTKISGTVEDIGWRSTRIKTLSDTVVVIPNAKLADSIIINDSMPAQPVEIGVKCGVAYEADLEKVEKIAVAVATELQARSEYMVKDYVPTLRFNNFGDSNIEFNVWLKVTEYPKRGPIIHEYMKALKKAFDKNKIEISYPVRKVYTARPGKK